MPTTNMPYSSATDYDTELRKLERKRQIAAALMAQGQQPLQGQMVGRVYVPPSPLQGISNLAQVWSGKRGIKKADEEESGLMEQRNAMVAQALRDYSETGDPAALMTNADTRGMGLQEQQATNAAQRKLVADALKRQDEQQGKESIEHIRGSYRDEPLTAEQRMELGKRSAAGAYAPQLFVDRERGAVAMLRTPEGITPRLLTLDGQKLMPPQYDPETMGAVSGAKAAGAETGKGQATAALDLPAMENTVAQVAAMASELAGNAQVGENGQVTRDRAGEHKGLQSAVGSIQGYMPGWMAGFASDKRSGFLRRLDQIKGTAFLNGRQLLKGGGAITDWESKRAEDAFSRMDRAQSEDDFVGAVIDFNAAVQAGYEKLKAKAGQSERIKVDY